MLGDLNAANQVSFQNAMSQYQQPFNLGSWYSNLSNAAMGSTPRYNSVGVQIPNTVTDPNAYPNPFGQIMGAAQQGLGFGQQVQNAFGQGGGMAGGGMSGSSIPMGISGGNMGGMDFGNMMSFGGGGMNFGSLGSMGVGV
jgi:hypothetical protein